MYEASLNADREKEKKRMEELRREEERRGEEEEKKRKEEVWRCEESWEEGEGTLCVFLITCTAIYPSVQLQTEVYRLPSYPHGNLQHPLIGKYSMAGHTLWQYCRW